MLRDSRGSNPVVPEFCRLVTLKPGYINVLYIFGNLQSLSIWTREVKSMAAFSVHDILSGMYLGLLHKIKNIYKHSKETVRLALNKEVE